MKRRKRIGYEALFNGLYKLIAFVTLMVFLILLFSSAEINIHVKKYRNSFIHDVSNFIDGAWGMATMLK